MWGNNFLNFKVVFTCIHIEKADEGIIAKELVKRGICSWTPLEEVAVFRGQKILNGLFWVPKPSFTGSGRPVLRLIMNLVPANAVLKQFQGATQHLPHITSWLSTFIEDGEVLKLWQSGMSNAFYLFRIPKQWRKFLSFNLMQRRCDVMDSSDTSWVCLSCNVLPMGWSSSVSIMQEVSEALLNHESVPKEAQMRRGRPVPLWMVGLLKKARAQGRFWWHLYLDNFAAAEVGQADSSFAGAQELQGLFHGTRTGSLSRRQSAVHGAPSRAAGETDSGNLVAHPKTGDGKEIRTSDCGALGTCFSIPAPQHEPPEHHLGIHLQQGSETEFAGDSEARTVWVHMCLASASQLFGGRGTIFYYSF